MTKYTMAQIRRMTHDERVELFWKILDRVTFIRNLPLAGRIRHLGELKPLTLTFNRLLKMTNAAPENYCTNTTGGELLHEHDGRRTLTVTD